MKQVHNGYFATVKKKGKVVDVQDSSGNTANDADVYELIMRDKERLLDDAEPLRFIFSHSALREGWDSPNVFQICTLREMGTDNERRQTLGRGLRLAVDADGNRVYDSQVNRLTVIANESFEDYARNLQQEMERDIGGGFKFGRVPAIAFAPLELSGSAMGQEKSRHLWQALKAEGYLDSKGDITARFLPDDLMFKLQVPRQYQPLENAIIDTLRSYLFSGRIKDDRKRIPVNYNKRVELNPDFQTLWEKISQKTRYAIVFDTQQLIDLAIHNIETMPVVAPVSLIGENTQVIVTGAGIGIDRQVQTTKQRYVVTHQVLPDLLGVLQERTHLTRGTLLSIFKRCQRLSEFKANPQGFITEVSQQIKKAMDSLLVEGIQYEKLVGEHYKMELFDTPELDAYLDRAYRVQHGQKGECIQTPYDYIEYDSYVEQQTAHALDGAENVRFFCKLPRWFKIPTPVGDYNPDWAVVLEEDRKVYLIRETKTTHDRDKRRKEENMKIDCGEV